MERSPGGDAATIRAIGGFAALLLTALHRERVLDIDRFADFMAIYATMTDEADPETGRTLTYWAGVVKEMADDLRADRQLAQAPSPRP